MFAAPGLSWYMTAVKECKSHCSQRSLLQGPASLALSREKEICHWKLPLEAASSSPLHI